MIYTVQRSTKAGTRYGAVHYANEHMVTVCGKWDIDSSWEILTNNYSGNATCKECLKKEKRNESVDHEIRADAGDFRG